MKKLFLLTLLFACPWRAQASEVKHEVEQKHFAQALSNQVRPAVLATSATVTASQAASVAISDEERAKLRMAEINRKHKANAEALLKRIADGQVIPGAPRPVEELRLADDPPITWKEIGTAFLYLVGPIAVLALGNGIANNISARYAGLGVKRCRSYQAPWWEFASGTVFRALQVLWSEKFFCLIGLYDAQVRASYRWGIRLGTHALVLQPIIGLLQELGETIPLGKFGPGWRSRTISPGKTFSDRFYAMDEHFYEGNLSLQIGRLVGNVVLPLSVLAFAALVNRSEVNRSERQRYRRRRARA